MTIHTTIQEIIWGKYGKAREYSLGDTSLLRADEEHIMFLLGNDPNGANKLYSALVAEVGDEYKADEEWAHVYGAPMCFRRVDVPVMITITGSRRTRISVTEAK